MRTLAIFIAALVIGLVAAFGGGYLYGKAKADAACEQKMAKIQSESVDAELLALKEAEIRTLKADLKDKEKGQKIETIKTQVVEKIVQAPPQIIEVKEDGEVVYLPFTFDTDTVRLLNEARTDETYRDAFGVIGGPETPSDVGIEEFVENDLEVVKLYHELANRYRTLQKFVQDHVDEGYKFCKTAS